jgi:mannosyltransferase OCH1-like enzyme
MFNTSNSDPCSPEGSLISNNKSKGRSYSESSIYNTLRRGKVTIPKIIMQTWKDREVPEKWKGSPKSIKEMMPDWKYILMTDEDNRNFVKKYFPDFLKYYDRFPHNIQRADAIRYMWLYINGGIYMDLDFEVKHPLDELLTGDAEVYLVSSSNVGSYITNSFMASKPRCKLWLEVIEAMKKKLPIYYLGKHIEVMNTTGPMMLTHVVKNSRTVYSMLPGTLILPCSVCNIWCNSEGAYMKQLEGSSWISYDTKLYIFFMCKWKQVVIFVIFILILILLVILIIWMDWI